MKEKKIKIIIALVLFFIAQKTSLLTLIEPSAIAVRADISLSFTSTMTAFPSLLKCVKFINKIDTSIYFSFLATSDTSLIVFAVSVMSDVEFWNSLMLLPMERLISGSFFGPKITRAITKIKTSSGIPSPNICNFSFE